MTTTRLEAFSDGVFAIVVTLLVLEIHVPTLVGPNVSASLRRDLIAMSPLFLSYALSFGIVCIWWVAHHHFFAILKRSSRPLLWLNSLFLFWLAFIPFPTALLGNYPRETIAVMCYGGAMALAGVSFSAMRYYAFFVGNLVDPQIDRGLLRRAMLKSVSNPLLHSAAVLFALIDTRIALTLYVVIPLLFVRSSRLEKSMFNPL
jgi:TMEM175 potassium channel family protein